MRDEFWQTLYYEIATMQKRLTAMDTHIFDICKDLRICKKERTSLAMRIASSMELIEAFAMLNSFTEAGGKQLDPHVTQCIEQQTREAEYLAGL